MYEYECALFQDSHAASRCFVQYRQQNSCYFRRERFSAKNLAQSCAHALHPNRALHRICAAWHHVNFCGHFCGAGNRAVSAQQCSCSRLEHSTKVQHAAYSTRPCPRCHELIVILHRALPPAILWAGYVSEAHNSTNATAPPRTKPPSPNPIQSKHNAHRAALLCANHTAPPREKDTHSNYAPIVAHFSRERDQRIGCLVEEISL